MDRQHQAVKHPSALLQIANHPIDTVLNWFTDHFLGSRLLFAVALIVPLAVLPLSANVKLSLGVISGSWIQWWALHALQRRDNDNIARGEAKADADHEALTHIALTVDAIREAQEKEKNG